MIDTYTKRPIYELLGKNNKRYFLYWVKGDDIETIDYRESRIKAVNAWIVRKLPRSLLPILFYDMKLHVFINDFLIYIEIILDK